jgi:sugar (pentulose or hexulose) kinase
MADKVKEYCQLTQQPIPLSEGEVIRAALQGLALRYRYVIEKLEEVSGRKMSTIHIVGGGTKNQLLSQFTADALGRRVITGPSEATGIGNLIVQAIANKDIGGWKEGVSIIRNSFEILTFEPGDRQPWDSAFELFKSHMDQVKLAY